MPVLLSRIQKQNEIWMQKLAGPRFRGAVFAIGPTALPTTNIILPRLAMRCRPREPVVPGDMFRDPAGRVLLCGEFDTSVDGLKTVSRLFVLFQMTRRVSWTRRVEDIDPVTQRPRSSGKPTELGPIWVSLENPRAEEDTAARANITQMRVITNADLKIGDMVNGQQVRQVVRTLGVVVAEVV